MYPFRCSWNKCLLLDFFFPAVLVFLVATKLHVVVVKLAVEIMDVTSQTGIHQFNLRDELFWFGKPRLLLWLIQFITFQWETKGPSCFTENSTFLVIRLTFGFVSQFWCSFITFPLYMGSKYKKSILSENVRRSLRGWKRKARRRREETSLTGTNTGSSLSVDSLVDGNNDGSSSYGNFEGLSGSGRSPPMEKFQHNEMSPCEEEYQHCAGLDD